MRDREKKIEANFKSSLDVLMSLYTLCFLFSQWEPIPLPNVKWKCFCHFISKSCHFKDIQIRSNEEENIWGMNAMFLVCMSQYDSLQGSVQLFTNSFYDDRCWVISTYQSYNL